MKKYSFLIFFLLVLQFNFLFAQEEGKNSVYTEFNSFFEREIEKQGIKGNWMFMLNEITAYHNFDFNNDGLYDVLLEFNAVPVDGGGYTLYYSVLFQNMGNQNFRYINYLESTAMIFSVYEDGTFIFQNKDGNFEFKYNLVNSKFVKFK